MKSSILLLGALVNAFAAAQPLSNRLVLRNGQGTCPYDTTTPCAVANLIAYDETAGSQMPLDIAFGKLYNGTGTTVTTLSVVGAVTNVQGQGIELSQVECQRYKDATGIEPGSTGFNVGVNASISTNPVDLAYILCYVVPSTQ